MSHKYLKNFSLISKFQHYIDLTSTYNCRIRKRLETSSDDGSKEEEPDSEDGTISEKEIPLDDDDQLKDKRDENEFVAQKGI